MKKTFLLLIMVALSTAIMFLCFPPPSRADLGDVVKWIYSAGPAKDYYGGITWVEGTWGGTYYNCLGEQVSKTSTIEFIKVQSAPNGSEGNNYVIHSVYDNGTKDIGVAWDKDNQCWWITDPWGYCGSTGMKIPKNGGSAEFVWYCQGNPVGITYDETAREILVTSNYLSTIQKWTYDGTGYPENAGDINIGFQSCGIERVGNHYWISYCDECYVYEYDLKWSATGRYFCIPEDRQAWELAFDGQYLWVRSNYEYDYASGAYRLKLYQIDIGYQASETPTPAPTPIHGTPAPTPIPGPTPEGKNILDYDGDGTTDIAVFRPSNGLWAVWQLTRVFFGAGTDKPAPADYNGDGTTEIAVYRPDTGLWGTNEGQSCYFGASQDLPVPADYNGDGSSDPAVFRPSSGMWALRDVSRLYFGAAGDIPVYIDFDRDGKADPGIYRPRTGLWAIRGITRAYYGADGDLPIPGDYAGWGSDQIAVFRPSSGLWAVKDFTRIYYGVGGYDPQPGDWNGDGTTTIAAYYDYADLGWWAVNGIGNLQFGETTDIPVAARLYETDHGRRPTFINSPEDFR